MGLLDYRSRRSRRSEGKQKTYKSSGQKQKNILPLTLTWVSLKSMCLHTATYRSFLSFCDQDGRQRSIPSSLFWQIEWREWNLLFLEGIPCGNRVRPIFKLKQRLLREKLVTVAPNLFWILYFDAFLYYRPHWEQISDSSYPTSVSFHSLKTCILAGDCVCWVVIKANMIDLWRTFNPPNLWIK